jgi:hypothetical protein
MNLQNYYYYFQSALTPRFCDELIKYGISQQEQLALKKLIKVKIYLKKI